MCQRYKQIRVVLKDEPDAVTFGALRVVHLNKGIDERSSAVVLDYLQHAAKFFVDKDSGKARNTGAGLFPSCLDEDGKEYAIHFKEIANAAQGLLVAAATNTVKINVTNLLKPMA